MSRVICTAGTAAVNPTKGAAFPRQAKPRVVARITPAANPNFDLERMFLSIELFFKGEALLFFQSNVGQSLRCNGCGPAAHPVRPRKPRA